MAQLWLLFAIGRQGLPSARVGGGVCSQVAADGPMTSVISLSQSPSNEMELLQLIRGYPQGIKLSSLRQQQNNVTFVNQLLQARRIELQGNPNDPVCKFVEEERAKKLCAVLTDIEIQTVYSKIEESGNYGIWVRDIRLKTNLMKQRVDKALKKLINNGLVKGVKSVAYKTRKLYMLANIVPHRDVTGGPWYTDSEFDEEFVNTLRNIILFSMSKKEYMSAEDVQAEFDSDARYKQILQVQLNIKNILEILDTLYFDGKIEPLEPARRVQDGVRCKFRVRPEPFGKASRLDLSISPCSRCHLFNECTEHGIVSPYTCKYLDRWLGMGMTKEEDAEIYRFNNYDPNLRSSNDSMLIDLTTSTFEKNKHNPGGGAMAMNGGTAASASSSSFYPPGVNDVNKAAFVKSEAAAMDLTSW